MFDEIRWVSVMMAMREGTGAANYATSGLIPWGNIEVCECLDEAA
jgi:hypothetical protein